MTRAGAIPPEIDASVSAAFGDQEELTIPMDGETQGRYLLIQFEPHQVKTPGGSLNFVIVVIIERQAGDPGVPRFSDS